MGVFRKTLEDAQAVPKEPTLEEALASGKVVRHRWPDIPPPNDRKLAELGIRKLTGDHLTLYTDLPNYPDVEELPQVFDAAFELWCDYFGIPSEPYESWHMIGFLIEREERFQEAGVLERVPDFKNGFSIGKRLWLYSQDSPYYRRHLLLHEGTHGFMNYVFGACGPPWFMEGMAELLATHRWQDGKLQMNHLPETPSEAPYWGRVDLIVDSVAENEARTIDQVLDCSPAEHGETVSYAWSWGLAYFFDRHPRHRETLRKMVHYVLSPDLTEHFREQLQEDRRQLDIQWADYVTHLEYGYDLPRSLVALEKGEKLSDEEIRCRVRADRGWQSSGLFLEAGETYRLLARGRYQVNDAPVPWWCEPQGVTLEYYQHKPLGQLQATILLDERDFLRQESRPGSFPMPISVGREKRWRAPFNGTLYLRINDSPGSRANNSGECEVLIEPVSGE